MSIVLLFMFPMSGATQSLSMIQSSQLTAWRNHVSDTVYVINFWATWCAPCVEELPAFEKLHRKYASRKVKVILVSTDFKRAIDTRLMPFIREKKLASTVAFMTETDADAWIRLVDPNWSGTIPATWIIGPKAQKTVFYEKPLGYKALKKAVKRVKH